MALAARLPKLCAAASSPNADPRSSTGAAGHSSSHAPVAGEAAGHISSTSYARRSAVQSGTASCHRDHGIAVTATPKAP